jgi:ribosomal protein S18 acetylase RimI-like enzyme
MFGLGTVRAEWALHQRAGLACAAAVADGVAGRFRVWESGGLLAVLATDPTLAFLSTVSGMSADNVGAAIDLAGDPLWQGARPVLVESPVDSFADCPQIADEPPIGGLTSIDWKRAVAPRVGRGSARGSGSSKVDGVVSARLSGAGFVSVGVRGLAVCQLGRAVAGDPGVVEADGELFTRVLLAGYEVGGTVAAFIVAEHRAALVRRFLLLVDGEPIAAAAMSMHDGVAVLGGAATLPAYRGLGAQSRLIRHRLGVAADSGCSVAVATAVPGSASAANLRRAGFEFFVRQGWGRSSTATDRSARLPR